MGLNLKFSGINSMLSRDEMKEIKGGYAPPGGSFCSSGIPCHGTGTCFSYYVGQTEHCCCSVDQGSNGGAAACSI